MKTFFSIIVCSFIGTTLMAQQLFRPYTETVNIAGTTIEVYHSPFVYYIQNKTNTKNRQAELFYQDGTSAYGDDTQDKQAVIPEKEIYAILLDVFTQQEVIRLQQERMSIGFVVSPQGEICEVDFGMKPTERLLNIPLERFAELDKRLRKLTIQVGPITKRLQFNWMNLQVRFSQIPIDLPSVRSDAGIAKKTKP